MGLELPKKPTRDSIETDVPKTYSVLAIVYSIGIIITLGWCTIELAERL